MRILGIDHIGIASADLGRHIEIFGDKLGLEIHDIHERFELPEDRVPDGDQKVIDERDIAKFVSRRGEGLHHIRPPRRRRRGGYGSAEIGRRAYPGLPSPSLSCWCEARRGSGL